jgi:hypothetical protein
LILHPVQISWYLIAAQIKRYSVYFYKESTKLQAKSRGFRPSQVEVKAEGAKGERLEVRRLNPEESSRGEGGLH